MRPLLRRWLLIAPPYIWLLVFFAIPFLIVVKISLSQSALSVPPYSPMLDLSQGIEGIRHFLGLLDLDNYSVVGTDDMYVRAYLNSLRVAFFSTLLTLAFGYPVAYAISSAPAGWKPALIMLVNLPFWTSFLIRIYAWMVLLSKEGIINHLLISTGIIDQPLTLLNTAGAVYVGMVYAYVPLMILPIYATLEKLDTSVYEAARDLGCSRIGAFFRVTLPMSRPGVLAGCFLVFIPATGEFVIPSLLGSSSIPMIGKVLWEEFFVNKDWPLAAAIAVLLLAVLVVPLVIYQFYSQTAAKDSQ